MELEISIFQPFVLFGAGGAGKSALLSKCARQSLKVYNYCYEFSIMNLSYLYIREAVIYVLAEFVR